MDSLIQPRTNLADEVAKVIKTRIINEELKQGAKLPNEQELVKELGISRATLREAIKQLIAENVVEIKRGRGTFVSENIGMTKDPLGVDFIKSKDIIKDLFETRLIIEPGIAALAAKRANTQDIDMLSEIICEIKKNGPGENHSMGDIRFHNTIAKITRNTILDRILPITNDSIVRGHMETVTNSQSFSKAIFYHDKIFEAIKANDADAARCYMKEHLEETLKDIFPSSNYAI